MTKFSGFYSILQFCPEPSRLEYVNVGVFLVCADLNFVGVRFAESPRRVERLYGHQNHAVFNTLKEAFAERVRIEFANLKEVSRIEKFVSMRANKLRMSKVLPIALREPEEELESLYYELVGDDKTHTRRTSAKVKLRKLFKKAGVLAFLDTPEPVPLPEFGISVSAPYGYQNGTYNMIDPVRLDHEVPHDALKEAGQRAIEGGWLQKHFSEKQNGKRLVVVGDFNNQSDRFFKAVREVMSQHNVVLHRMDDLNPLLNDIKSHMTSH
ncbi:MAG TPA: DUF3037 domain-containing protein [Rhodospirillaceae bacterium]|nr:hypothetical protein [Magnetovibrio sp.]HBT42461.1 DUF3037 domain-containing protein [Rhodospirillaceae bacterium]HCS68749.1 DUF3037 domain-containing protein [Rhodospirillaceae bacterium]|tara:strand:- start:331 stop:1131 length:801 start_codon:yes stop_codon:yes gene_type:complete